MRVVLVKILNVVHDSLPLLTHRRIHIPANMGRVEQLDAVIGAPENLLILTAMVHVPLGCGLDDRCGDL